MATTEKNGTMKYKDGAGNVTTMYPKTKMSQVDGLSAAIEEAKPFVVTILITYTPGEENTLTADKTYAEIKAAIDAGKCCYAIVLSLSGSSTVVFPIIADSNMVQFAGTTILDDNRVSTATITIMSDNTIDTATQRAPKPILVTGIVKGAGDGYYSAAVAGTDYVTPDGMNTAIQTAIQNTWEASY